MAVFQYVAFDADGGRHRGLVEGATEREARERLRGRKLFAAKVKARGEGTAGEDVAGVVSWLRRDRSLSLALPLRELATLLSAGVPLAQALGALSREAESSDVEAVLRGLRERVLRGEALSDAMAAYPSHFGVVTRSMAAAGEAGGELDATLARAADQLRRRRAILGQVSAALLYPAILAAISVAVVVFLLSYVVPRISRVYLETGATLPAPTRLLLGLSGFVASWWAVVLPGVLVAYVGARLALRREGVATAWDAAKLRLPFVGVVYRKRCVADFARTLGGLLEAGVPMVEALKVTAGTLGNRAASREVERVAREVELGDAVSGAVRARAAFPETVAELLAAGEESGEMVELLGALAEDYERQVALTAERACRALEPLVVVLMGGVVLFIVLSVLLPIVRMSELVRL